MDFESHLLNGIPHAEAAAFFLHIRGKDKTAMGAVAFDEAVALMPEVEREELLKSASALLPSTPVPGVLKKANMMGAPPPPLPPGGHGQNMSPATPAPLPPTAMGQQNMAPPGGGVKMGAAREPDEAGTSRARANFAAGVEKDRLTRGERFGRGTGGLAGMLTGGLAGVAGGQLLANEAGLRGRLPAAAVVLGGLGGAYSGHRMGKGVGGSLGHAVDVHRFNKLPAMNPEEKAASAFKTALDVMGLNEPKKPQQMGQQEAPMVEEPGAPPMPAGQEGGIEPRIPLPVQQFLEAQRMGDEAAEQSHAEFLRGKLEEARAGQQQAQEEAAALQEQQAQHDAQQAQIEQQVQESIQQASQAQDQVLQEQQASAAMRMAYQQLRGQVLQLASTDPPALSSDAAALSAASTAAASQSGPGAAGPPAAGPAGQAPTPGTPNTPAPLGDETVTDKDGIEPNEPTFGNAAPTTSVGQKEPQGDAKTPQKEVLSHYRPLDLRKLLH